MKRVLLIIVLLGVGAFMFWYYTTMTPLANNTDPIPKVLLTN